MKKILTMGLALLFAAFFANAALALTPNHSYTVGLYILSSTGQQTAVDQMDATTDANGKLSFEFTNVPNSGTAPFLMVQIIDPAGGPPVRQTLVPAPTAGQHMQMGVSEVTSRQTQVALQAMQSASGNQALRAMFPILMVPTGAISSTDAVVLGLGQAANSGVTSFNGYLTQNGVTASQINSFQNGMLDAMREFAAANKAAVDETNPGTAAGLYGKASAEFMSAMVQAGVAAGIDPFLMSAAFDQAGHSIDNSQALNNLPSEDPGAIEAMQASFLADAQQRQLMAQMGGYGEAMPVIAATATQTQTFTTARNTLQTAMVLARQNFFRNAFADPTTLPDQNGIDVALNAMQTAMQTAFNYFNQETTATSAQISTMLGVMADGMNSMGGMSGGMMSGSTLEQMGFGMMQTTLSGATQNWSIMMVASSNLVPDVPNFAYTPYADRLVLQFSAGNEPPSPNWNQIPDGPYKSMLQLQYDLMLVRLIDAQAMAGLTMPPSLDDLASISATDFDNRIAIRQGVQGLSATQMDALMAALSPPMPAF